MSKAVRFQDPGEGIHDGEVVAVRVAPGDEVKEGQVVLVVETDKAEFEVESPFGGRVDDVRIEEGDVIEVGDVLFTLESAGSAESEPEARSGSEEEGSPERGQRREERREREEARRERDEEGRERDEEGREREEERRERKEERRQKEEESREQEQEEEGRELRAEGHERPESRGEREETEASGDEEAGESEEVEEQQAGSEPEPESRTRAERPEVGERAAPVPASPATRRIAREMGVDLRDVTPSGEEGRVLAADVRGYAARVRGTSEEAPRREPAAPALPDFSRFGPVERVPLRSVRRTIARRMSESWRRIPHVTHGDEADVTELDAFRRRRIEEDEESAAGLTITVLAVKAAATALKTFPRFNTSLDHEAEELIQKHYCHVGVAVDTDRGLIVPVLRDVDRKSTLEVGRELAELAERARGGALQREEMEGGSFTVTNVGAIGGRHFTPIINPPQVAILGLGRVRMAARVRTPESGHGTGRPEIAARLVLPLSLAFDHRVIDGAEAARFTNRLIELLEDPERFAVSV